MAGDLLYERTREQAREDWLTGLLGRRAFHEVLETQADQAEPFSIVLLDIDDFKDINDLYGHQAGDEVLRLVADALRAGMREGDGIFRVGGEEFGVVLPGLERADALIVAERLRRQVAELVVAPLPVTVSLGVASFPYHARHRDESFEHADTALYASKRAGKNRVTIAGTEPEDAGRASDRHGHLALLHRHDAGTAGHSATVATIAVDVARALGRESSRLADLRTAAKLHDIGKIGVPDADPHQARAAGRRGVPDRQDAPDRRRRADGLVGARRAGAVRARAPRARQRATPRASVASRAASRAASSTSPTR